MTRYISKDRKWTRWCWVGLPAGLCCLLVLVGAITEGWTLNPEATAHRPWREGADAIFRRLHPGYGEHRPTADGPQCTELVRHGAFRSREGWTVGTTPMPAAFEPRGDGTSDWMVRLGPRDTHASQPSFSSIWQELTLPSDAEDSTLRWRWSLQTAEAQAAFPATGADRQQVLLLDASGSLLEVLVSTRQHHPGWRQVARDLSAYRGQTVRVYFSAYNDGNGQPTTMRVDDVSLQTCHVPVAYTLLRAWNAAGGARDVAETLPRSGGTTGFLIWCLGVLFAVGLMAAGVRTRGRNGLV